MVLQLCVQRSVWEYCWPKETILFALTMYYFFFDHSCHLCGSHTEENEKNVYESLWNEQNASVFSQYWCLLNDC